jgi:hypothetical protein
MVYTGNAGSKNALQSERKLGGKVLVNDIKNLIRKKRDIEAENRFLRGKLKDEGFVPDKAFNFRVHYTEEQIARIENWLHILTEDEVNVITRHLIDGIDLPRIALEYKERWGDDYAKTERTIKSYQRRALQKIARFEEANQALVDGNDSK